LSIQAIAAVLDTDVGESSAKMLLVSIANAHNHATGICCPSIDRLAAESSMSRSTVKRWLRWLEEHHFIEREERRDTTGRQQSYGFILTLSQGFILNPSQASDPQDVEGPDLNPRGFTGEPGEGFTAEPPLKKPEEKPLTPQPPASGGLRFDQVWEVYPQEHRGNRDNAEGAYGRLSSRQRADLAAALPLALKAMSRRKSRYPALAMFIRNRVFEDFIDGPDVDADGAFIVTPARPEWGPWLGFIRKKYGQRAVDDTVKRGFFLPDRRWPEGHELERQAA
jgi:hypothetical protein